MGHGPKVGGLPQRLRRAPFLGRVLLFRLFLAWLQFFATLAALVPSFLAFLPRAGVFHSLWRLFPLFFLVRAVFRVRFFLRELFGVFWVLKYSYLVGILPGLGLLGFRFLFRAGSRFPFFSFFEWRVSDPFLGCFVPGFVF